MFKIKLLKEYTYMSICDIDFNVLIDFDYDDEVLLYSLRFEDHNSGSSDFLINFASSFDEENVNKEITTFMLDYIESQLNCYIDENEYDGWKVVVVKDGLKLINDKTQQHATWNVNDYDEDFEVIQDKIKKFLELNNHNK